MSKPTVPIRASAAAVALLVAVFFSGSARGQNGGSRDPAAIPSPTGMLYGGGTLEFLPNGQPRLSEYPSVSRVDSGSVSAAAGLKVGDVLLSVNGRDGREARLFRREHGETRWIIRIRRDGEEKELAMEVPPSMLSASRPPPAPRR
ncbi:MAG TPA: PDZ domain-containing protein [Longimicrobium sp.]|jgi:membrane-associated protease RseP (regulator of RpoE activity)|nr:PDZ domain-containing protein [Longimicrobium sp.]